MQHEFVLKNNQTVIVRSLTENDYDSMCAHMKLIGEESINTNQYPGREPIKKEQYLKNLTIPSLAHIGVFSMERQLVGMLRIFVYNPGHPWNGRTCQFAIHILKEYQNCGLGKHLMSLLDQWAKENKMHRIQGSVRTKNDQGIALYLKSGFAIDGLHRETAFINGQWHDEYTIYKIID